jgi:hypothetical protein
MGGKNRGRRTRGQATARRAGAHGRTSQALRLPGLREVYDATIAACSQLAAVPDALDAELWLAGNVCSLRTDAPDDQTFHLAMLDLVDRAERVGRPECLVLLRTMAAAGPWGVAEPASHAAERLAGRMARDRDGAAALPGWLDALGDASVVGDCSVWTDVFGEYMQVYGEFVHTDDGRRHGLLFTIDLAFHGVISGVDVVTSPRDLDRVVGDLDRDARRDHGRLQRVPPAEASDVLRAALVASADGTLPLRTPPTVNASMYAVLPLAVRRVSGMPGGRLPPPGREEVAAAWPPHRRQALVDQFITAHPDGWADPGNARMFASRIVDTSIDVLGFPPDRIGPVSVTRLFGEVLPATIMIPESLLDQAQRVAHAWVRWRADAQDLPRTAHRQVRRAAQAALTAFPHGCRDRRLNPTIPYVADTPAERTDGPTLTEILHRRRFAVPLPGQRGDGVVELPEPAHGLPAGAIHVDALDAGESTHRHLITAIGQAAHGTHPQHFPVYAEVVEQLWNDQPATVWRTAQHLSAAGLPRQQVLDRLAETWKRHRPDTMDGAAVDPGTDHTASYAAALHTLGAAPQARRSPIQIPKASPPARTGGSFRKTP